MIAPAQAGPSSEKLVSIANATLPKVSVDQLLDPQGEPLLTQPQSDQLQSVDGTQVAPSAQAEPAQPAATASVKPSGDLRSLVAMMRSAEAGSRELQCLATGIYFESKGEPLAGQLAVGKVIANRAQSGGRFPSA